MKSMQRLAVLLAFGLAVSATGGDWPMWRHDARRSGATDEELPAALHPQWVLRLPRLEPAWPDEPRMQFDVAYQPVVVGRTLFLASPRSDWVAALDIETGSERWRVYMNGPVRFAPVAWKDRLFIASDDGFLTCLAAADGKLLWRFRGGLRERRVLGNRRLISTWLVRGAPVMADGVVYFAAGIWPFMGVLVTALDAETGRVLWRNDGLGSFYHRQPHSSPAFSGIAPQGYLAVSGDRLLVPNGRSVPACLDRATGRFLYYHMSANGKRGGYDVAAGESFFWNAGLLFDLDKGASQLAVQARPVLSSTGVYRATGDVLTAWDAAGPQRPQDKKGKKQSGWVMAKQWDLDAEGALYIQAGRRLYMGGLCRVMAVDLPGEGGEPGVSWAHPVAGTPAAMAAADGRLFVSLAEGLVYCFGAEPKAVSLPEIPWIEVVPRGAMWRYLDDGSDQGTAWLEPGFDDRAWRAGPAQLGYGEKDEATVVDYGEDKKHKHITTYFRLAFDLPEGLEAKGMRLRALVDDGAIIYLNGMEVWRPGMARDAAGYLAPAAGAGPEGVFLSADLEPDALRPGRNVLAVEVHQSNETSSDLSFDLDLWVEKRLPAPPPPPAPEADKWTLEARRILRRTGVEDGVCLVLGLETGRLAEELARQSALHVVAVEPDAEKVAAARRRLDATGLYGPRVAVLHVKFGDAALPPYLASLVVSEDLDTAKKTFVETLFHVLRPYGGAACLRVPDAAREAFAKSVADSDLENADLDLSGEHVTLRRAGALPGSGDWTHQYGDAANTVVSRDSRVKAPLGLLWFGGSSNRTILPRHGHGPSEQVVGGRLFIEGPDSLRAMDVYTGRVLWEREFPGIGAPYDSTLHQPGANAIGSNYASAPDALYIAYGAKLLRLDPATGQTVAEFALPASLAPTPPLVSYLAVHEDLLVAGGMPISYDADIGFGVRHVAKWKVKQLEDAETWFRKLDGFRPVNPRPMTPDPPDPKAKDKEKDAAEKRRRAELVPFVVENANRLLAERDVAAMLDLDERTLARTRRIREEIALCIEAGSDQTDLERSLPALNRALLEQAGWPMPRRRSSFGAWDVWSGTASKWLLAMNRHTGKVLWARFAAHGFHHNAIAIGDGKLFCVDRLPVPLLAALRRRGEAPHSPARLLAVDVRTGDVRWSTDEHIFGTWLGYSAEHDLLMLGARASRDMLDEPGTRMTAYRGRSGGVVWDVERKYSGPCMLHGDTLFTQNAAFSLLTGEPKMRRNPVTLREAPWTFARNYGCNTVVASLNLLTFRSAAAGFYDLVSDSGTANLGGFKSGCTSNLIVANGVLNAPDYTRTCVCSYHNQTSLAFVHDPDVEVWTFLPLKLEGAPVRRLGLNLGAPGDRMADDGTLWIDSPNVGGPSPDVKVAFDPKTPDAFRHHVSWADRKSEFPWVAASGVVGAKSITVTLRKPIADETLPYTVRLVFVEPEEDVKPGGRLIDVVIQGENALSGLDVVKEARGARRALVREFRGIRVKDKLTITLSPAGENPPVLCGIEILAQGW